MSFDTIGHARVRPVETNSQKVQVTVTTYHIEKKEVKKRKTSYNYIDLSVLAFVTLTSFMLIKVNSFAKSTTEVNNVNRIQQKQTIDLNDIAFETVNLQKMNRIPKNGGFDSVYMEAGKKYNVPWQLLASIHFVETGQSGDTERASSAGALGPMQFMENTFNSYKQDGDGDGNISIYDVHDAIFTAAKNLSMNGASSGNVRAAVFNYNHSYYYVDKVMSYANDLGYTE